MTVAIAGLAGIHMLIAAVIIIGWLLHRVQDTPLTIAVWAARIQLLLGLLLVVLNLADGQDLNYVKLAVKFIVALGVLGMLEGANKRSRRGEPSKPLADVAGVLTLVNVFVAFLWK